MIKKKDFYNFNPKLKRHPCWREEIERLEHSNFNMDKFTTQFERDYWRDVDDKYDQLVELDKSKKKLVNQFPGITGLNCL